MKRNLMLVFLAVFSILILTQGYSPSDAEARAGGGRSFGSRGSRSYSRPASPSNAPSPYRAAPRQASPASPSPFQQPQPAGGFLRSMAGGVLGGMLGGMLFRSMGFGGGFGGGLGGGLGGGGGIGIFDIILIGGILYFLYRFLKSRRQQQESSANSYSNYSQASQQYADSSQSGFNSTQDDLDAGLSHIRQMDAGFDERAFCDQVMDSFFRIQGAWMNRDLSSVQTLLNDKIRSNFQDDIDRLVRDHQINRLENIAVRNVEISEAWQEQGDDFITVLIYANLLDYTTNDQSGEVISGSKTEPVKFEEFWTFTRPVGRNAWKLSGIDQK